MYRSQNPQCEGRVDRVLFSNDLKSIKGYYTAKLELVKDRTATTAKGTTSERKPRLQAEAGLVHGGASDAVFDIWAGMTTILDPPLYTCKAIKVGPLRTTLTWQGDHEPPQTFIAKPQKSTKPTLRYHTSAEFKDILSPLLKSQQAQNLPFCLMETTRELADVSFSTTSDGSTYQILAPEELEHPCEGKRFQPLKDIWELSKSIAFYYHHLRQENLVPLNIKRAENQTQAFMSMFDVEVYRLDETGMTPISQNLNRAGRGVRILIDDDDDDDEDDDDEEEGPNYGFKITNTSTFDVYPHLFYFNSHDLSISQPLLSSPELAGGC
jgi:hypothetical protein